MSLGEDTWPLPDYNPGPTRQHLHALGVLSLTYATLQRNMDDLFLLGAARKQIPPDWTETYYYALSEDRRSQAIKDIFNRLNRMPRRRASRLQKPPHRRSSLRPNGRKMKR
jgi:hypothetical protein